jgi:hypothetical protein
MARSIFKPVSPITPGGKPPASPAHHIASQFSAVKPVGDVEGEQAQRDMYQVDRDQRVMEKNPFGITHGKP